MLFIIICCQKKQKIFHIDFHCAYLNLKIDNKEILVTREPKEFSTGKDNCWLLNRYVFGLSQVSLQWHLTIIKYLKSKGYTPKIGENCIFTSKNDDTIIGIYIDDLLYICPHETQFESFF